MKRFFTTLALAALLGGSAQAQFVFPLELEQFHDNAEIKTVVMEQNPLQGQVLFTGGVDEVISNGRYNPEGKWELNTAWQTAPNVAMAKQWHDFIGFTPDNDSNDLGWVVVNHERVDKDDSGLLGDGGGMTVFKVKRNPQTDALEIVDQTLDGFGTGKFFNVDFAGTVGETGMNCGGINSADGRVWTAEEWFRKGNESDVFRYEDFTINKGWEGDDRFEGKTVQQFENLNYMVEIDPKTSKAIRKQYNWGRFPFEGGAVMPDNKTVYMGADDVLGTFTKFVADVPGDFTKGKLYAYKHDHVDKWVELDNSTIDAAKSAWPQAITKGASLFRRLEWVVEVDGKVYMTETGRDDDKGLLGSTEGVVIDPHIHETVVARHPELAGKPAERIDKFIKEQGFADYYGRVLVYDPRTKEIKTLLEGGPYFAQEDVESIDYPEKHLSNPDGLAVITVNYKDFLIICEDLNGSSHGRVPAGSPSKTCEMWMLDLDIKNPTIDDLHRIAVVPNGAEVTGARATSDGKSLLFNAQHPSTSKGATSNNSFTYAITGWNEVVAGLTAIEDAKEKGFSVYPNPVAEELHFDEAIDAALYDQSGARVRVVRNQKTMNVSDLTSGVYVLKTSKGETTKVVIK